MRAASQRVEDYPDRETVGDIIDRYLRDGGRPPDMALDVAYQLQMHVIRTMLSQFRDALAAEDVPGEIVLRLIRRVLYGSPWPGAEEARDRMRKQEEAAKAAMLAPLKPLDVAALLGLPPR